MRCCRFYLFPLLLLAINLHAQKKNFVPPGTVKINDTLFADTEEISNISWREYLFYLQQYEPEKYEAALPDTTVWLSDTASSPLTQYYFRHPGFNSYPVTGISYEQAVAFCAWRTHAVNLKLYLEKQQFPDPENHFQDSIPVRVIYRLPTETEWEFIAASMKDIVRYPYGVDSIYRKWKKKYTHVFNCVYPNEAWPKKNTGQNQNYTSSGKSFWPNNYGIYQLIGNVAEMVQEEGISKGGSFAHRLEDCKISSKQHYTTPQAWLGFRCVAVLIQ